MKNFIAKLLGTGLVLLSVFGASSIAAAADAEEFHSSANMKYGDQGVVPEAHGYLRVISDTSGNGLIDVMFFNGNPDVQALFNASVRFLDASGQLLTETHFNCRLADVTLDGAGECKVSKPLHQIRFVTVEVDFYLSDVPEQNLVALN